MVGRHEGAVVELIAHRGGNLVESVAAALAVADAIEIDVHTFRGRLEVRHAKVIWPWSIRWERWYLIPTSDPRPTLAEILAVVPDGSHLWIDLKGFTPRFTRRVLRAVGDRHELTMSARSWWILGPARRRPGTRVMRSVGNRFQRWLVTLAPLRPPVADPARQRGVVLHERLADPASVTRLRRHWAPIVTWAVEDLDRIETLRAAGVDGVIADDLALIAAAGPRRSVRPSPTVGPSSDEG
jgi:hypothetical protein